MLFRIHQLLFWIVKNWADVSASSESSTHSSWYSNFLLEYFSSLIQLFSWSKIFFICSLTATSKSWNFVFFCSLLFSAKSSTRLTKSKIKFCGPLFYKKMGSSIKIDDLEIEVGTCFPIQVVVCISFSSSVETQFDSRSKKIVKIDS